MSELLFTGIFPATVLPFRSDLALDEDELRREIRFLAAVPGVTGLVCNGHAGETYTLSEAEIRRVTQIHVDEVGDRLAVISGVDPGTTAQAIAQARQARADGAAGVLVMPPRGLRIDPDDDRAVVDFFSDLSNGVDIPLVVFRYGTFGTSYAVETLPRLAEIPNVVAIKDAAVDQRLYERDVWALRHAQRRISILNAQDWTLLAGFVAGADGSLVSFADVAPHWIAQMFAAVQRGDLRAAYDLHLRMFPVVEALTTVRGFLALKEMLHMLGVLEQPAVSRWPDKPLTEAQRAVLWQAIEVSGLRQVYEEAGYSARGPARSGRLAVAVG